MGVSAIIAEMGYARKKDEVLSDTNAPDQIIKLKNVETFIGTNHNDTVTGGWIDGIIDFFGKAWEVITGYARNGVVNVLA